MEVLPDVPSVSDFVPGCEGTGWQSRRGTPADIIDKLSQETNAALTESQDQSTLSQVATRSQARLPTSASSLPMKLRNGPR
jgi:hypothetical protein